MYRMRGHCTYAWTYTYEIGRLPNTWKYSYAVYVYRYEKKIVPMRARVPMRGSCNIMSVHIRMQCK